MAVATRTVGGVVWTVGGYAAVQVLRFAFNLMLTKLVAPKMLGVMALVNLFVQGLQMFSDLGVRQCVIRHPRGDEPGFLNTAWTVQVLRGFALWVGSVLLARPMAAFYGEPALAWLLPLAGLNALVAGFSSTSLLTYSRRVDRGPLVRREVGVFAAVVVIVPLVLWVIRDKVPPDQLPAFQLAVIVGGSILSALCEVALSYTLSAVAPPRFGWCPEAKGQLLRFGGWVFLSTACTFLASQADRLVVGKLSLETLGVYQIAVVIAAVPTSLIAALGTHLVFPKLSESLRRGDPPGPAYRRAHGAIGVLAGWLVTGAVCVGPVFIGLVYDDRYRDAAGYIQLLGAAAWFTMLTAPGELLLLAAGRPNYLAVGQMVRLACLPGLLYVGYTAAGVPGLILAAGAGELVRYAVVARYVTRAGAGTLGRDLGLTVLTAAVVAGYLALEPMTLGGQARPVCFAAGSVVLTVFWAGVFLAFDGRRPAILSRVPLRFRRTDRRGVSA